MSLPHIPFSIFQQRCSSRYWLTFQSCVYSPFRGHAARSATSSLAPYTSGTPCGPTSMVSMTTYLLTSHTPNVSNFCDVTSNHGTICKSEATYLLNVSLAMSHSPLLLF